MSNMFDVANATEGEPSEIVAGDFLQWKVTDLVTDYPTDEYTLVYTARVSGARDEIQITATGAGTYYLVSEASTEGYAAGDYSWQQEIVRDSDSARIVLKRGTWKVVADLDNPEADIRSHAQVMVDKIESILAGKADSDVASYSVAGRSLTKMTFSELIEVRDYYRAEYKREKAAQDAKNGIAGSSTIKVRF